MLYKTAIGHSKGSLCGAFGPATLTVPKKEGHFVDDAENNGLRVYRVSPTVLLLEYFGDAMVREKIARATTKEREGLGAC